MRDPARLMKFVLELRQAGVTDARVLAAMERTPRAHYAPAHLADLAFDDIALPLAHGQAMTKASIVGRVLTALDAQADHAVLEVGTGSGFQSAVLAEMARKVVTLERWRNLVADARARFGTARLMRVYAHVADGLAGWADEAPYDRIVINGAVAEIPAPLLAQLKPEGVLVAPVGERLIHMRNGARQDLGPVTFAPLEPGLGEETAQG